MRYVFDLDGVLVDLMTPVIKYFNIFHNIKIDINAVTEYKLENCIPGVTKEMLSECFDCIFKSWWLLQPYKYAHDILCLEWNRNKKPIRIVTNRKIDHVKHTYDLVECICKYPYELIINTNGHGKELYMNKDEILIEDRRETAINVANKGNFVYLIKTPYNTLEKKHPRIYVVDSLKDIIDNLKNTIHI